MKGTASVSSIASYLTGSSFSAIGSPNRKQNSKTFISPKSNSTRFHSENEVPLNIVSYIEDQEEPADMNITPAKDSAIEIVK